MKTITIITTTTTFTTAYFSFLSSINKLNQLDNEFSDVEQTAAIEDLYEDLNMTSHENATGETCEEAGVSIGDFIQKCVEDFETDNDAYYIIAARIIEKAIEKILYELQVPMDFEFEQGFANTSN